MKYNIIYKVETIIDCIFTKVPTPKIYSSFLSNNHCIYPYILNKYPEYIWNYYTYSNNPNLTFDFILSKLEEGKDGWNWNALSNNPFEGVIREKLNKKVIEKERYKHMKYFNENVKYELIEVAMHPDRINQCLCTCTSSSSSNSSR